jgi:outer membrane protein OmpA-like peptidoglycan-associated protein
MKTPAITVITMGILSAACAGRGTPAEVLNPLPAFTQHEPERAPLLAEEEELQAVAAEQNQGTPMAAIVIVGMTENRKAHDLEPVYFAFGSAVLDPADMEQLSKTASWLRQHPDQQVVIEGHTDAIGTHQYNQELGEQRARAVRDYLIQLGVTEERLTAVSLGEEQPVSEDRSALNRRSEVVPVPDGTEPR